MNKQVVEFKFTDIQNQAFKVLHNKASHILLYGGARSGKSYVILSEMVFTALQFPKSRQLAGRLHLTDAIASLWSETLTKVLSQFPSELYTLNKTEHVAKFANGSEIFIAGFDDKERTEKILGREFCRIYLNECSQIDYNTVTLVKTRLAQKVPKLRNKLFYDENPPSPTHWTYKLFIQGLNPESNAPLENPENYKSLKMNPIDNQENLAEDFLEQLESLPEDQKQRFLYGEFVKPSGTIYERFDRKTMVIEPEEVPDCELYSVGIDLGNTTAAILVGFWNDNVYVIDEIYEEKITAHTMNELLEEQWSEYPYVAYLDHNWGEQVLQEFSNSYSATKGKNSVEAGINYINQLIEQNKLFISTDCYVLLYQIENYKRDSKTGKVIKVEDHALDAMRYAIFTETQNYEPLVEVV